MEKTLIKNSNKKVRIARDRNTKHDGQEVIRSYIDFRGSRAVVSSRESLYRFDVDALDSLFDAAIG